MTADANRTMFPQFYDNPAICSLQDEFRWTISGKIGADPAATGKAPIDARELIDNGRLRGAWAVDRNCLLSLSELIENIPDAANHAFYLQAAVDGLMVLDIEPDCPAEIADQLLALPETLYAETSMSGHGFHLVLALPENFYEYPVAAGKKVLREEHGWYELLLEHWVTFTRQLIPEQRWPHPETSGSEFASSAQLYAGLAQHAKASAAVAAAVETSEEQPEIPDADRIVHQTVVETAEQLKSIDEFNNDTSRWEFSVLNTLYRYLRPYLSYSAMLNDCKYSDSDRTWLLYRTATEVLPARDKHRERRNGRPYLLDRAAAMVANQACTQ